MGLDVVWHWLLPPTHMQEEQEERLATASGYLHEGLNLTLGASSAASMAPSASTKWPLKWEGK